MLLVVRGIGLYISDGFPQRTWSAGQHWLANVLVGDFYIGTFRVYASLFWFIGGRDHPRLRADRHQGRQLDPGDRRQCQRSARPRR